MMDRTTLDRFTASQQLLVAKAQERLAVTASLYSGKSTEELQAILAHQYGKLVTEYGDAVAAAAARMYEELRPRELGVFNAEVAAQYSDVEFAARLRQAAKGKTQASLAMGLQKDIMDMGRETIAHNMRRDKSRVKWARVPRGKTCAWCTMLASRGWVYASEVSAGGRGHEYHASCDCMIVPSWEHGTPKLKGYDSARLNEQYQTARKAAKSGDPRKIAAKMRELFPDECTDGHIPEDQKQKPGPKAAPSWLNARNNSKILDGVISVNSDGIAVLHGGHVFGKGWHEKTEFPESWDRKMIIKAVKDTWLNPDQERISGDRRRVRKIINGVLIEVSAYGEDYSNFRAAFPVAGNMVFENTINGRIAREIDESWEVSWV